MRLIGLAVVLAVHLILRRSLLKRRRLKCAWVLWVKDDFNAALEGEWTVVRARATRQDYIRCLPDTVDPRGSKGK